MEERFRVGIYTTTFGIKGEIKVFPTTDNMERYDQLKQVILDTKDGEKPLEIERVRYQQGLVIVKFKGINNINDIEKWKGASLFVTRENAVPLPEGSYFIADILDSEVLCDDGRVLGLLEDVMQTGANDVFVVKGEIDGKAKEYLIPNIHDCVLSIRPAEKKILVHLLDGLEEL